MDEDLVLMGRILANALNAKFQVFHVVPGRDHDAEHSQDLLPADELALAGYGWAFAEMQIASSTRKADERARDLPNIALLRAHDPSEQPAHREPADGMFSVGRQPLTHGQARAPFSPRPKGRVQLGACVLSSCVH
jgi:hypothetical protein